MTAQSARVTNDWLRLRAGADRAARDEGGARLAAALTAFLRSRPAPARLVDVGAGAGGGAAWLRERLGVAQRWVLVDHDPALLAHAPAWASTVCADLDALPRLLAAHPADAVTCQALLDLLAPADMRGIVDAAVGADAALLAALTVTGRVTITPAHADDALIAAAFDAHQRRDGRLGPDAGAFTADALRDAGYTVTVAHTPWRLERGALLDEWLTGRAAAAAEQAPPEAPGIARWLAERRDAAVRGALSAVVDHVDVLGLPVSR